MSTTKRRILTQHRPPGPMTDGNADPRPTSVARERLGRWSIVWRTVATFAALAVLTAGQFLDTNDFFPLGSLTQYATAKDLNGSVNSTCVEARFPGEDEPRRLGFNTATIGIERGDVEAQLHRVIDHPELMQAFADSYVRLHPDEPKPEEMILCRSSRQLHNGLEVGEPEKKILATWEVR